MVQGRIVKRCGHNPVQFLVREVLLFRFRMHGFVTEERVGGDDTVSDGFAYHGLQPDREIDDSSQSQMAFGTQIQVIFLDEGEIQRSKGYVRHFVLRPDEPLQMAVCVFITCETFCHAVYPDPFLEIADEPHEIGQ